MYLGRGTNETWDCASETEIYDVLTKLFPSVAYLTHYFNHDILDTNPIGKELSYNYYNMKPDQAVSHTF